MPAVTEVECFVDPSCRWAWWTSVWLRRVARLRPLTITWRLLSLAVQDNPDDFHRQVRPDHANHIRDFELLRPLARARHLGGNDAFGRLYAAYGNALHGAKEDLFDPAVQSRCLTAAELPAGLFREALSDPVTEEDVVAESRAALARGALGTPCLALPGAQGCMFGPILGQVPAGDEALELWEHVQFALSTPYLFEVKRNRASNPGPQFDA